MMRCTSFRAPPHPPTVANERVAEPRPWGNRHTHPPAVASPPTPRNGIASLRPAEAEVERADDVAGRLDEVLVAAPEPARRVGLPVAEQDALAVAVFGHREHVDAERATPRCPEAVAELVARRVLDARLAVREGAEGRQPSGQPADLPVRVDRQQSRDAA